MRKLGLGMATGLWALVAAGAAAAEGVYAAGPEDGQPAASCSFGEVALCYLESPEFTSFVTTDSSACFGGVNATPIRIEYAKMAMHSGLARIQVGDQPFRRAALGSATGADHVMGLDGAAYIVSQERFDGERVLLTTRGVEETDHGTAAVTRVRVGVCAEAPVYWSEAFLRGEVE